LGGLESSFEGAERKTKKRRVSNLSPMGTPQRTNGGAKGGKAGLGKQKRIVLTMLRIITAERNDLRGARENEEKEK